MKGKVHSAPAGHIHNETQHKGMNNRMMNKPVAALAVTAAIAFALTGCGGSNTVQPPAPAAAASTPAPAVTPSPTPTSAPVGEFGGTVTFPSGVKLTLGKPVVVVAGQYSSGGVEGKIVTFDISVTNGSKTALSAAMLGFPSVTYGANGDKAEMASDFQQKIGAPTFTTILPGETQTGKAGYGIPAAGFGAVRVEFRAPSYTEQPAIFKGAVG